MAFFSRKISFILAEKEKPSKENLNIITNDHVEFEYLLLKRRLQEIVSRNPGVRDSDLINLLDNYLFSKTDKNLVWFVKSTADFPSMSNEELKTLKDNIQIVLFELNDSIMN